MYAAIQLIVRGRQFQQHLQGHPLGIHTLIRNHDGMNPCSAAEVTL